MSADNSSGVSFGLFDSHEDIDYSARSLPHWFQPGVAAFITFRTADSLPRAVIERWDDEQRQWLLRNGILVPNDLTTLQPEHLPATLRRRFRVYRDRRLHWHLDQCHGECLLRRPELAQIVADALLHFDGDRYDLDRFVVMPNHVHLLVQFRPPTTLREQCRNWLHYTAVQINRILGRRGRLWQGEPFDHLLRSGRQFTYLRGYIADNPEKARLRAGEYLYWERPM